MALSFPLSIEEFFDPLPVASVTFRPFDNRIFSETGGGEVISAARGPRLWGGEVSIDIASHAEMAAFEARLSLLEQPGASLLIYDRRKPFPSADPGGALLANASPLIASLDANNREIGLSGLPANYVLSDGDLIGWSYGTGPVRHALHRIVKGATCNSAGACPAIELTPRVRPGTVVGAAIQLVRPVCKAIIDEATYGSGRSVITNGGSFRWKQTLR